MAVGGIVAAPFLLFGVLALFGDKPEVGAVLVPLATVVFWGLWTAVRLIGWVVGGVFSD